MDVETVLLIIGFLAISAVGGVLVSLYLRMRSHSKSRFRQYNFPHCANCGYNVHALHGSRCPECGAQLRAVGLEWRDD